MKRYHFWPLLLLAAACFLNQQNAPAQNATGAKSIAPILAASSPLVAAPPEPGATGGLRYRTSWVGNNFGQSGLQWVQLNATALYVAPDGTCYTNSKWDEGHHAAGIYRDGQVVGTLADMPVSGGVGGWAVTGDGQFVYASVNPWEGGQFLRRFNPDGSRSSWTDAKGERQDQLVVTQTKDALITAVSVNAAMHRLFVSVHSDDLVKIYDTQNLSAPPTQFSFVRPGRSVVAPDGTLWIIQEGDTTNAPRILHVSGEGQLLPQAISAPGWSPTGMVFDAQGHLMVADNGPDQNVKIYADLNSNAPRATGVFGQSVYSGVPGQITPAKWGSSGLVGIGRDAKNNIYAILNGADVYNAWDHGMGLVLESRQAVGTLNWRLLGLEFVDSADVDTPTVAGNALDVYTKDERFTLDLSKTGAGSEWTYAGHTANRFKYPSDERFTRVNDNWLHIATPWVRNFAGGKFLFVTDMGSIALRVYRFNRKTDGEVAIPCAIFSNDALWRDANGDGIQQDGETVKGPGVPGGGGVYFSFWADSKGDIWQTFNGSGRTGLRHFAMPGLDEHGVPRWDYGHTEVVEQPSPFDEVCRAIYSPENDTMILSGYAYGLDPLHRYHGPGWGNKWIGSVVARYDNWSKSGGVGNVRKPRWTKVLDDYDPGPISLCMAGDFVFVGTAHFGDNSNSGRIQVLRAADGTLIGSMHAGPEVNNTSGTMDVPYGINAFRRANGEYLIFSEEDWYAKVLMFRWTPETTKPAAPVVQVQGGNTVALLSWSGNGASRFVVKRAGAPNGPFTQVKEQSDTAWLDTGLGNGKPVYYSVQAIGAAGDSAPSIAAMTTPNAKLPLRINVGGGATGEFLADIYGSGGNTIGLDTPFKTQGVANAAPANVYNTVRRGNSSYIIPGQTPGVPLKIRLHFGEWWFGPGARKVSVSINGQPVVTDLDAALEKGAAVVREVEALPDANGQLKIEVSSPTEAMISGIEILPQP